MSRKESLREYFRRARHDAGVRAHLLETAKYARSAFGWVASVFAVLAVWQSADLLLRGGRLISGAATFYGIAFVINMLLYDKFGERVIMLASMDGEPVPAPDTEPAPGASPAGHGTGHPTRE